jgi:hypothetical protein
MKNATFLFSTDEPTHALLADPLLRVALACAAYLKIAALTILTSYSIEHT